MHLARVVGPALERPTGGDGFVRAETAQEAVALVGHPEVNVYTLPPDAVWPGDPGESLTEKLLSDISIL